MAVDHRTETIVIADANAGDRLDRALAVTIADLSRSRLKALILAGEVTVGGRTVRDPGHRVNAGDAVTVALPPPEPAAPAAEKIPLNIVFEDDEIIIIDKPRGMVVHPAAGKATGTLVNALIAHCGASLSGIGGVARPGIVHRLDKDTSGLLVVAKTDRAHRALAKQFADHGRTGELERGYLALVWGGPSRPHGMIEAAVGRHPASRTKMAVVPGKGRDAVTHWRVVETFGRDNKPIASLIECTLETGRTHQVRVHLAHIGHPLIGDPLYGRGFKSKLRKLLEPLQGKLAGLDRQGLHAEHLAFVHPESGTLLKFNSPLPADLAEIVAAFKEL
jgi:23S rRNA pseudouridine1911/1915/1917 synthase